MGNTEEMMVDYYNSPKTVAEGKAWFKIGPDGSGIVALPAAEGSA